MSFRWGSACSARKHVFHGELQGTVSPSPAGTGRPFQGELQGMVSRSLAGTRSMDAHVARRTQEERNVESGINDSAADADVALVGLSMLLCCPEGQQHF